MDLNQLANLGEFIGGAAVLVTLVYLAVQVRAGAREQRLTSMREATRELASALRSIVTTPEQAELFLKGLRDFESLDAPQRLRFSAVIGHLLRLFEQLHHQREVGDVDTDLWAGFEQQFHDLAAYPGFESWWPTRRHWYGPQFRSFMESHIGPDNVPSLYGETTP